MSDIETLQLVILVAAVALMVFTTYNAVKLRAHERALERDAAEREAAHRPAE